MIVLLGVFSVYLVFNFSYVILTAIYIFKTDELHYTFPVQSGVLHFILFYFFVFQIYFSLVLSYVILDF